MVLDALACSTRGLCAYMRRPMGGAEIVLVCALLVAALIASVVNASGYTHEPAVSWDAAGTEHLGVALMTWAAPSASRL